MGDHGEPESQRQTTTARNHKTRLGHADEVKKRVEGTEFQPQEAAGGRWERPDLPKRTQESKMRVPEQDARRRGPKKARCACQSKMRGGFFGF